MATITRRNLLSGAAALTAYAALTGIAYAEKNIITDYGAIPGQDCTAAFQAAATYGGQIRVPPGQYILSSQSDACVVVRGSTRFVGEGWPNTQIVYKAPYGVDCFTFRPTVGAWSDGAGIENMQIAPAGGTGGRYAIRIDLSASGAQLRCPSFAHLFLECGQDPTSGACADAAFKVDNPSNINGFYTAVIGPSCQISGGIKILGCGDSVSILDNVLFGQNAGVYATFQPGAERLKIARCNVTSAGGAAVLFGAWQASIEGGQCEQDPVYTGPFNAMYVLSGCRDCEIVGVNINNHGNTACIVLENGTTLTRISRDVLTTAGSQAHILIGPNSPYNAIGASNTYYGAPTGDSVAVNYVDPSSPLWNAPV